MVMLVKDRMSRQPVTVRPKTSVSDAGALTLLHGLKRLDKRLGLATLCIGGGQGIAMVIER